MLWPMGLHAIGVIALGVAPALGFMLVRGPTDIALASLPASPVDVLQPISDALTRIGMISGALALAIAALIGFRSRAAPRPAASHRTWGCGYGAPGPRMQYTGSSFSSDFIARFKSVMVMLRRGRHTAC